MIMPIRLACDSDNLADLIATPLVFTYADLIGTVAELADLRRRFPSSAVELIDRGLGDPLGVASVADFETGTLRIADAPGWWEDRHRHQIEYITAYADAENMPQVAAALGPDRPAWHWWARWGEGLTVPGHPTAMLQFASAAMIGEHIDLSAVHNENYHKGYR